MTPRTETRLWAAQRLSALVLLVCVCVHLITITAAVRGGLSAAEILARTHGSAAWAVFYGAFVLAAAVHAPVGLRALLGETLRWRGRSADAAVLGIAIALVALGFRAVWAVYR